MPIAINAFHSFASDGGETPTIAATALHHVSTRWHRNSAKNVRIKLRRYFALRGGPGRRKRSA
jgi:hypothetical protein